jgi:PAS domain S-box-containing protein
MSVKRNVENSHEYAERIINTVREPLIALDQDLRVVSASRSFYEFFKVNPEDTMGQLIYDLGNKQWDIPKLRELLEKVLPEKEAFDDYEVIHNFQDIGHKVMLLNARKVYRKDIGEKMILLAIEDITERKRLEDLLKEAEERYRRLFETANDGMVLLEKCEGKITHTNPATERMLGYSQKESIGNTLQGIGVLLDMGDFQTTMQNLNKIGIIHYNNVPVKTKSGQHIDTDIYLVDRARLVQCNIRDISERKRAEYKLSESEKQYRTLFNTIDEGFCIIEVIFDENEKPIDYRFLEINPSFVKQTGLIDAQGKRMRELAPKHEDHWFEIYGKIAVTGQPVRFVNRAEQLHRWYDVYAFRLGHPENRQVAILFNDITERKRVEDEIKEYSAELIIKNEELRDMTQQLWQAAKLATMGELSASIAHELNNPLATVTLRVESLLAKAQAGSSIQRELGIIEEEVERMGMLVGNLLQFSRLGQPHISTLDVREEIEKTLELVYYHLRKSNINIEREFVKEVPHIHADRQQLRQLFLNLFTNASDAMPHGGTLTLRLTAPPESRKVIIEVADTGTGIAPDILPKVLEPFYTTKPEGQGKGLGLAICRRIAKEHGGIFDLTSEGIPGRGTTVHISFPLTNEMNAAYMKG